MHIKKHDSENMRKKQEDMIWNFFVDLAVKIVMRESREQKTKIKKLPSPKED